MLVLWGEDHAEVCVAPAKAEREERGGRRVLVTVVPIRPAVSRGHGVVGDVAELGGAGGHAKGQPARGRVLPEEHLRHA